jgi:hypothetical protein
MIYIGIGFNYLPFYCYANIKAGPSTLKLNGVNIFDVTPYLLFVRITARTEPKGKEEEGLIYRLQSTPYRVFDRRIVDTESYFAVMYFDVLFGHLGLSYLCSA